MNALKLSACLSFLFLLQSLATFFLGTDFYYLVGFSSEKIAMLNSPLTSDLADRWLISSFISQGIFILYVASAINIIPKLPFLRSVISAFIIFFIISTLNLISVPFTSNIEEHYQFHVIWLTMTLLQLILTICCVWGLKQRWKGLSKDANWREAVTIIVGLLAGSALTIFYVPDVYHEWIITLIAQNRAQLSSLPDNTGLLIVLSCMALPKILLVSLTSALFIAKIGQYRCFIYSVLVSFIFLSYVLNTLPFISILVAMVPSKMEGVKLFSDIMSLILFMLITATTLKILKKRTVTQDPHTPS